MSGSASLSLKVWRFLRLRFVYVCVYVCVTPFTFPFLDRDKVIREVPQNDKELENAFAFTFALRLRYVYVCVNVCVTFAFPFIDRDKVIRVVPQNDKELEHLSSLQTSTELKVISFTICLKIFLSRVCFVLHVLFCFLFYLLLLLFCLSFSHSLLK